jgi:hypothetical protein
MDNDVAMTVNTQEIHNIRPIAIDDQIQIARNKKIEDLGEPENKSRLSKNSKMSMVSFVTTGGTRKKKPILCINTKIDDDENMEDNNEDIENINSNVVILKSYESYTFNDLRIMARKLFIPTTYKEKNKTKQYKKEELYEHIQKSINPEK